MVRLRECSHGLDVWRRDAHVQGVAVYDAAQHAIVLLAHAVQHGCQLELSPGVVPIVWYVLRLRVQH